jgi:uncharacterized Zn-finger protein
MWFSRHKGHGARGGSGRLDGGASGAGNRVGAASSMRSGKAAESVYQNAILPIIPASCLNPLESWFCFGRPGPPHGEIMNQKQLPVVELEAKDLPAYCPNPAMPLWSSHPRVFLDFGHDGVAKCPYCGTEYMLKPGTVLAHH